MKQYLFVIDNAEIVKTKANSYTLRLCCSAASKEITFCYFNLWHKTKSVAKSALYDLAELLQALNKKRLGSASSLNGLSFLADLYYVSGFANIKNFKAASNYCDKVSFEDCMSAVKQMLGR